MLNMYGAWAGILCGMVSGAVHGLGFHHDNYLGGYATWRRRLCRLGHISFFGLAFINLAFAVTVHQVTGAWSPTGLLKIASFLLVAGAVLMPTVCYLSAFRERWRDAFFAPVGCLVGGVIALIGGLQ